MFKEVKFTDIKENFVDIIANEWMLTAAGDENGFNMMTASWGFVGQMWNKNAAVTVLRPSRYTKEFVDKSDYFTLSFYGEDAKKTIHSVCGTLSGRDVDKCEKTGLNPVFSDNTVYFDKARLVLICKKIYQSDVNPDYFIDKTIDEKMYDNDYHTAYIGEVVKCYINEENE